MKKLILTLAAVVAMALPGFAAKAEKTKKEHPTAGIVKSVNADSHTLTLGIGKKDKKSETYKVAADVDLSKVKVGDDVQVKLSDANEVTAVTAHEKKKKE